jgi:hypothetical protein
MIAAYDVAQQEHDKCVVAEYASAPSSLGKMYDSSTVGHNT